MLTANMPAMNRATASKVSTGPCFFTGTPPSWCYRSTFESRWEQEPKTPCPVTAERLGRVCSTITPQTGQLGIRAARGRELRTQQAVPHPGRQQPVLGDQDVRRRGDPDPDR